MTASASATPGPPMSPAVIEELVIETMRAASSSQSVPVFRDTEVLQVVDSLGLMMSLANIQSALKIKLEPTEVIAVLQAHSIGDVALALTKAVETRRKQRP